MINETHKFVPLPLPKLHTTTYQTNKEAHKREDNKSTNPNKVDSSSTSLPSSSNPHSPPKTLKTPAPQVYLSSWGRKKS